MMGFPCCGSFFYSIIWIFVVKRVSLHRFLFFFENAETRYPNRLHGHARFCGAYARCLGHRWLQCRRRHHDAR